MFLNKVDRMVDVTLLLFYIRGTNDPWLALRLGVLCKTVAVLFPLAFVVSHIHLPLASESQSSRPDCFLSLTRRLSPMASLQPLPTELLQLIISETSPASLLRLSLTCKQLHEIATPLLYQEVLFKDVARSPRSSSMRAA